MQYLPQRRKGAKKNLRSPFAPLRLCREILLLIVFFTIVSPSNAFQTEPTFAEAEKLRSEQREDANLKAIDKYREAATTFQNSGDLKRATVALRNAGEILQLLGNSAEALICYQQAHTLSRKTKDLIEQAKGFNNVAYLQFLDGNTKEAETYARAALKLAHALGNRAIEAEALNNLGEALSNLGDRTAAQEHEQQALAIWRELNDPRGQAISSISLGYNYKNMGQPEKAFRLFAEALSLARQAKDLGIETQAAIAIANINRKTGNNQAALESYAAARAIAERIGDQTAQAIVVAGIGSIYFEMGDDPEALRYFQDAMKLFERNGKNWGAAEVRLQLGRVHHSMGDDKQAIEYLNDAVVSFRSLRMPLLESSTLRELGFVYDSVGDKDRALESYKSALQRRRASEDQRETAYLLSYIGHVYEELKDTTRSLQYYREALPLSQRSADPVAEALIHNNLAHLYGKLGNLADAKREVETALALIESQRANVLSQDLRTSYFATVRSTYEFYIDILMQLHKQNPGSGFDRSAFAVSERARARSFLELLSEARAKVRDGVDPALLEKERELSDAINDKAQRQVELLMAKRNEEFDQICKELDNLVAELAQTRDKIREANPRAVIVPELLTLDEVQRRVLDDDTVLLEYVLGDERSYVWVATRTSVLSFELAPRKEIETSARKLHELIASRQMIYGEPVSARTERQEKADLEIPLQTDLLSKLILGPLAGTLEKKRLLVVADGALQYVPFQMLTAPETGNYLVQKYEIVNLPSASTLALLQSVAANRKPAVKSVAVLADPVFEVDDPRVASNIKSIKRPRSKDVQLAMRDAGVSPDGVQIRRLMASGAEADEIIAAAPWHTAFKAVGFDANREIVLGSQLANYRIIHFATHGLINSERPELSGIVLSLFDSEGQPQNGFLRLHDIYNLHLPADLVVLSACSTGLGKDVRGEGLIGLTRGFMYAGASGVIASLWKVDDDATAELMKHFYEGLFQKGMAPAAALRYAQLTLSQNKRWESPYYWAGFVIQGQYTETKFVEPFPTQTQLALLGSLGGILLLSLTLVLVRKRRQRV
jgi:CHAT domain-containing protein